MFLRKLVTFAITSGLAAKMWRAWRTRRQPVQVRTARRHRPAR